MSGKPNEPQIDELRKAALEASDLKREIARQRGIRDTATANIDNLTEDLHQRQEKMIHLMTAMDLASSGNTGWEGRITYFLTTLVGESK